MVEKKPGLGNKFPWKGARGPEEIAKQNAEAAERLATSPDAVPDNTRRFPN